ncbi:MAG: LysM peptidoglycan-binding domain-containing protein [Candidatus Rifleibacteriota bacterium]
MRKRLISFVVILAMLSLPCGVFAKSKWTDWWKPGEWFGKKQRSTTVTGVIDSVAGNKVVFRTLDGQMINLIGDQAAKVAENRTVKIRVFGNVFKPDQKYPTGALQVRGFKVLEEEIVTPKDVTIGSEEQVSTQEPEPYVEPEPVLEPEPVQEEPAPQAYDEEPSPAAMSADEHENEEPADEVSADVEEPEFTEYVVVSGDTLGKISKKIYGTTGNWKKIAKSNGITNPKLLKVGMTLRIPKD